MVSGCRQSLVLALVGVISLVVPSIAKADVVLDWNKIAVETAIANAANPFQQARFAAIVQLAVFEAVNAITGDYEPYLGTIGAEDGASAEAAAIAAAHRVLSTYFSANPMTAAALDAARTTSLAAIPDGPAKTNGIATGEAAAAAMIALRANDGSSPLTFYVPGPAEPGVWQMTPSCTQSRDRIGSRRSSLQLAECHAIWNPECGRLHAWSAAVPHEQPHLEGLQRSPGCRRGYERHASSGSHGCREVLRGHLSRLFVEPGGQTGRECAGGYAFGECASPCVNQYGVERRTGHVVHDEVPLSALAAGNVDSGRWRKRQSGGRSLVRTVHYDALLSELPVQPCEWNEQWCRSPEAPLRRRGPQHRDD